MVTTREQLLEYALNVALRSLRTYGRHPIIEKQAEIAMGVNRDSFTIDEFRNYLSVQDSMGDIWYNLNSQNIINANKEKNSADNGSDQIDITAI